MDTAEDLGVNVRAMMPLASAAFFARAYPLSVSCFFGWLLLSGISGGIIMVLVAMSDRAGPALTSHLTRW